MSTVATTGRAVAPSKNDRRYFVPKAVATAVIVTIAGAFVLRYVFRYYLNYNEEAFTDPVRGALNYWAMRGWLVMHMTGGMVALLTGPWQFWTGFRVRYARLHRWTGRVFLGGVAVGLVGAFHMAVHTSFGWAFGFASLGLALAWFTTSAMAYYAILKRKIAIHKEWMVRAYVVTFGFVTFRVLNDFGPTSQLQPVNDRAITIMWSCWVIPLLVTEVILQLRRMGSTATSK